MAEQFINTFEGGMNSDVDPSLQLNGTYRNALNCTLINQTGNNYTVKDSIGNVLTFKINTPYAGSIANLQNPPIPLAFISTPNNLIVISTNNEVDGGDGYMEIGKLSYLPYGEGVQPDSVTGQYNAGYIPLYHSLYMNGSKRHRIEGIGIQEGNLIERIYWTDNFNAPRTFNVGDSRFTTYLTSGNLSTTNGTKYMVLEGAITYNGDGLDYGPGLVAGNVFTIQSNDNTFTDITTPTPTAKVIEYVPYELFDWTPNKKLGGITFDGYGNGSVNCGSKIYFYRYGLSKDNYFSPWSYPSSPVHVDTLNEGFIISGKNYLNTVGAGTKTTTIQSSHSVKMKVDNLDTNFDIIQLAVAEYDNLYDVPRNLAIVTQDYISITDTYKILEHIGNVNLGNLTIDDLTLFSASIEKIKTLDTDKNYLLIGNITERAELDIDFLGANTPTLSQIEYEMPSYPRIDDVSTFQIMDTSESGRANPSNIFPESHWLVTDDSGGGVAYNGNTYTIGETFTGVDSVSTVAIPHGSQIRPCIVKNRYTTQSSVDVKDIIQMKNDWNFWDYKDPLVHSELTGYWSSETYRFGILFYDLKGNPYYVRWIGDYSFSHAEDKGGLGVAHKFETSDYNFICLNPSGLRISGLKIPKEIVDKITGFSIVRAPRDARVLCQGIVTQCATDTGVSPNVTHPGGYIPMSGSAFNVADKQYCFISPDLLADAPLKGTMGVTGATVEGVAWQGYDYVGGTVLYIVNAEQNVSKMVPTVFAHSAKNRTGKITGWHDLSINQGNTFPSGAFENTIETNSTPTYIPNHDAVGEKKVHFTLEDDFLHYSNTVAYTHSAGNGISEKILMNYINPSFGTPYNGTGEQALANTVYISTGHYQEINNTVITDTCNTGSPSSYDYLEFNNVDVWGGDCFLNLIDYGYGQWSNDFTQSYSWAWQFPCECNANYNLRHGRKQTNSGMYYTGDTSTKSIVFLGASSEVRLESFQYNQGYSTEGQQFLYPALPVNFLNQNLFKARVRFAGPKFINEINDSFRTFLVNDYKDLDVVQGGINSIKTKEGRVFVWQDLALSTVPVLEREILSNLPGSVTVLGTGGVATRYDPISSYYGTQHQWSVISTEFGFVYFDMRHKAFVSVDGSVNEVSFISGMSSFFNEVFNEVGAEANIIDDVPVLNSPTFSPTSDMPLVGVGITGVYDPKFKITYMTFKFYNQKKFGGRWSVLNKDFTIMYYHPKRIFIGFSDFTPAIAHNHNYLVLAANNSKNNGKYYGFNMPATSFVVGDIVPETNVEYICISNVTIDKYPPTDPTKAPEYSGSIYWQKVNSTDEIWVNNQPAIFGATPPPGYLYNKIFGKVVSNEIEFVVNPKVGNAIALLNMEQQGNLVNATDVYLSTETLTASDLSISSTNRKYSKILDKICSSLPLYNGSRLTGTYSKIKLVKKNWTSDPTTVSLPVRLLRAVFSYFEQKR